MTTVDKLNARLKAAEENAARYRGERDRLDAKLAELGNLIDALEVLSDDLGTTSIPDPELSRLRNAVVGVSFAMARQYTA